jgi:hypothetical protein
LDIPAQAEIEVLSGEHVPPPATPEGILESIGVSQMLSGAIFCRDFLERRWCFPIAKFEPPIVLPPVEWRAGRATPRWASDSLIWGTIT